MPSFHSASDGGCYLIRDHLKANFGIRKLDFTTLARLQRYSNEQYLSSQEKEKVLAGIKRRFRYENKFGQKSHVERKVFSISTKARILNFVYSVEVSFCLYLYRRNAI